MTDTADLRAWLDQATATPAGLRMQVVNADEVLGVLDVLDRVRAVADDYDCGGTCSSDTPEWARCISCRLAAALEGP